MKGPVLVGDHEYPESSSGGVSPHTQGSGESIPDATLAETNSAVLAPQTGQPGADEKSDKRTSRPSGEPLDRDSLEIKLASLIEEMHGELDASRPAPGEAEGARVHLAGLLPAAVHSPSDLGAARVVVGAGVDPRTELTVVGRRGPGGEGLILEGIEEEPLEKGSVERTFVEGMRRARRKRAVSAAAMVVLLVLGCIAGAVLMEPAQSVLLARAGGTAVLAAGGEVSQAMPEEAPLKAPIASSHAGDRSEMGRAEAPAKDSVRRQAARTPPHSALPPREVRAPRPSRRAPLGAGPDY
jgi:hypothetical protein